MSVLAIYGAIISTIALIWNILRDINKGKLKVECFVSEAIGTHFDESKEDYEFEEDDNTLNIFIDWKITNIGKKSILLTHIGGADQEIEFTLHTKNKLPKRLNPGDFYEESMPFRKLFCHKLKFLGVWDSLERIYKIPKRQLKYIMKCAQKWKSDQYKKLILRKERNSE